MLAANQRLGKYRIKSMLGAGGMATVYLATDSSSNRQVAIKVLPNVSKPELLKRFAREAKALARLSHPNIIQIFDLELESHPRYYVMAYVEACPLDSLISKRYREIKSGFNATEVADFGRQLAAGLDYAHARGVIHRDVKPANVLVSEGNRITLMDFGLAGLFDQTKLTRTGQIMGTARYMAPEQLLGEEVGSAADVYALGLILYELAAGMLPFEDPNPVTMAIRRTNTPIPLPRELRLVEVIPVELEQLILRCLELKIEKRPSCQELVESLTRWCESKNWDPTLELFRPLSHTKELSIREAEAETRKLEAPSKPWKNLLIFLALIIFSIGGVLAFLSPTKPPTLQDLSIDKNWGGATIRWSSQGQYKGVLLLEGQSPITEAQKNQHHKIVLKNLRPGSRLSFRIHRHAEEVLSLANTLSIPNIQKISPKIEASNSGLYLTWDTPIKTWDQLKLQVGDSSRKLRLAKEGDAGKISSNKHRVLVAALPKGSQLYLQSQCSDGSRAETVWHTNNLLRKGSAQLDKLRNELAPYPTPLDLDKLLRDLHFRFTRKKTTASNVIMELQKHFPSIFPMSNPAGKILPWLMASTSRSVENRRRDENLFRSITILHAFTHHLGINTGNGLDVATVRGPREIPTVSQPKQTDIILQMHPRDKIFELSLTASRKDTGFSDGHRSKTWNFDFLSLPKEGFVEVHIVLTKARSNALLILKINDAPHFLIPLPPEKKVTKQTQLAYTIQNSWLIPKGNSLQLSAMHLPGASCPDTRLCIYRVFLHSKATK